MKLMRLIVKEIKLISYNMPVNLNPAFLISEDGVICAEIRVEILKRRHWLNSKKATWKTGLNRKERN